LIGNETRAKQWNHTCGSVRALRYLVRDRVMSNQEENWLSRILRFVTGAPAPHAFPHLEPDVPEMRAWMLERLERGKQGIHAYLGSMTHQGAWDSLVGWERLRNQLELIMARVQGLAERFRGFRPSRQTGHPLLDQFYDCEADLLDTTQNLVVLLEKLQPSQTTQLPPLHEMATQILRLLDERESLLKRRNS